MTDWSSLRRDIGCCCLPAETVDSDARLQLRVLGYFLFSGPLLFHMTPFCWGGRLVILRTGKLCLKHQSSMQCQLVCFDDEFYLFSHINVRVHLLVCSPLASSRSRYVFSRGLPYCVREGEIDTKDAHAPEKWTTTLG